MELQEYKYGFQTDVRPEAFPKGLSEDIIRLISEKRDEPEWLLDFRLAAYKKWKTMKHPDWHSLNMDPIDYNDIYYYSAPETNKRGKTEIDDEIRDTFKRLGIERLFVDK